jgi:hypothetical protein
MGIRSIASKPLAQWVWNRHKQWMQHPELAQQKWFTYLMTKGQHTAFGVGHGLYASIPYEKYRQQVHVREYEQFSGYIERIKSGERDVLWPGVPSYFAKTSGTTSGTKYIPISKESMPFHIAGARDALLGYIFQTGKSRFLDGKLMFLSGSPELEKIGNIQSGRLSGIVNHHVPAYLRSNQLPDFATNCIEDWEEKLDAIVTMTIRQPMTLLSGIPPWVQMYFDKIIERTGKPVGEVFPTFEMFVYGGVNFEPYRLRLEESIGRRVASIETYPASEGFIAFQNDQEDPSLLLLADGGIFFEFIEADRFFEENPPRVPLHDVKTGVNYAVVLTTNAGLWSYAIGDMVRFTSISPPKIVITGRVKHFISAFGEHVIGEEVERAMQQTCSTFSEAVVTEFTVAPIVNPADGETSHHQWLVEFDKPPADFAAFAATLDRYMRACNSYYDDLIKGNILIPLKVVPLQKGAFITYMQSIGKLGGQNKVPRLSNDRRIADVILIQKVPNI